MDVYRIGVTISMVNNASAVLGVIQRDVLGLHQSVDMLTGGFTAAKAAVAGLGAALGGDAALGVMGKLVGQGKELARQQGLVQEQLRHMPAMIPALPTGRSTSAATQALMATGASGDVKDAHQLTTASAKAAGAESNLTFNVKARALMGSIFGDGSQGQSLDLTKPSTALGSSQKPNALMDAAISTSSFIDPILSALARRTNASGGSEAGNPPQPTVRDLTGSVMKGVRRGDRAGATEPQANAYPSGDHIAQHIGTMFATQRERFETASPLNRGASEIGSPDALAQNDPTTNIKTFRETWNNLLTALDASSVDTASNLMVSLTHAMNDFSQWAVAHPELIGAIEKAVGALAAVAAAAGLFAIGAKAATALGLLTGPVGLIGLAAGIETLGKALPSLPSWLEHLAAGSATGVAMASVASVVGTPTGTTNGAGFGPLSSGATNGLGARMPVGSSAVPPSASGAGPNGPLPVYVVNGRDIADGTTAHQAAQISAPPTGPTGGDPRMNLPMPAFGAIVGL